LIKSYISTNYHKGILVLYSDSLCDTAWINMNKKEVKLIYRVYQTTEEPCCSL